MRDQHKAPGSQERQPGLFLERDPGTPAVSEELDEIVPDFMHRDFYRSQEGDVDIVEPVEPSGVLRAVRSESGGFRASSLRGPARSGEPDPEPQAQTEEPLKPIRGSSFVETEPEPVPDETVVVRTAPTATPSALPRPVETGGINLPLLLCLFFVVGLFMWREQTRPVAPAPESNMPVPRRFRVEERPRVTEPERAMSEAQPQPVTTPNGEVGQPAEQQGDGSVAKVAPEPADAQQGGQELFPPDDQASQAEAVPDTTAHSGRDADSAAQRAAILERMSAGTVDRNDRERRMEGDLQDSSLFPATKPEPKPRPAQPVAAKPAAKKPAEVAPDQNDGLFPEESTAAHPQAEPPAMNAPAPAPAAGGKPKYQIAEPQL